MAIYKTPASSGLPIQSGNSGKFLTTNGSSPSWATLSLNPATTNVPGLLMGYTGTGVDNTVKLGNLAGDASGTTTQSVYIGQEAGIYSSGSYNVVMGYQAGRSISGLNVVIGNWAGYNQYGSYLVTIGHNAGRNASGDGQIAIGANAGYSSVGGQNIFLGNNAGGGLTSAGGVVAIGSYTLASAQGSSSMVVIGTSAAAGTTGSVSEGVIIGDSAGYNVSGNANVIIGLQAGYNVSGTTNTIMGQVAATTLTSGSNNTILGYLAQPSSATVSNEITIGNTDTNRFRLPGLGIDWTTNSGPVPGASVTIPILLKGSYYSSNNVIPLYSSPTGYDTAVDSLSILNLAATSQIVRVYLTNKKLSVQKYVGVNSSTGTAAVYSTDGITWTTTTLPYSNAWMAAYGNNMFVALGASRSAYSTDGITWTAGSGAPNLQWGFPIAYGNGTFVALSQANTASAVYSTDGFTWSSMTMPTAATWQGAIYANGIFYAYSNGTQAATSTDGINWTSRTTPAGSMNSVAYGNGMFFASLVTISTSAYTSTDGITWTTRTLPASVAWRKCVFGNGTFVITSNSTSAATSTDGVTWAIRTLPANGNWATLTYGNGLFVTQISGNTYVATSTDGITWTQRTSSLALNGYHVNGFIEDKELIYKHAAVASNSTVNLDADKYDPILIPAGYALIPQASSTTVNFTVSGERWINA